MEQKKTRTGFLKKIGGFFRNNKPAKVAGLAVLGLAGIYLAVNFLRTAPLIVPHTAPEYYKSSEYGGNYASSGEYDSFASALQTESPMETAAGGMLGLFSARNAASLVDDDGGTAGGAAENYETAEYRVNYESRDLEKTCNAVGELKPRPEVVFENAVESDKYCRYTFKVQRARAEEILGFLKSLNPKDVTENIYTIQERLEDYTGQIDILEKKLAVIDDTLNRANAAYDEVSELATEQNDAETLSKVINNKINTIKQLTQERLNTAAQLEQLRRSKSLQADKLDYTYFNVYARDNSYVDWQNIKDSWQAAAKNAIGGLNRIAQSVSVNLAVFLLEILQYAIYGAVLLIAARYFWKAAKAIWKK
jgi:hypothetical protein